MSKKITNSQLVKDLYPEGSPELERYSDLQVLSSGAGWYIGTTYAHKEGFIEPGSRDSGYYPTREQADDAFLNGTWNKRVHA